MARVLVTGSSDGLGLMTGRLLAGQGHDVTFHARNAARAADLAAAGIDPAHVAVADLRVRAETVAMAERLGAAGGFDAVVHNAAVGNHEPVRQETVDGLAHTFAVNVLAPYLLTALLPRPRRLVFVSSATHRRGDASLADPQWEHRPWSGAQAYADSKLFDVLLAFALSRRWPDVRSNAVEPGWVPTKMGGPHATDDLAQGHLTQAWLATSDDPAAAVSGRYFYHLAELEPGPLTRSIEAQEALCTYCEAVSGVPLVAGA